MSLGLTDLAGLFPAIPTIKWSLLTIAFLVKDVGTIGTIVMGLRLLILFPAIAVRAADFDWRTA